MSPAIREASRKVPQAKASSADAAMDYLLRLLGVRERSVQEVQGRLLEKGYHASASSCAIERALACGLLDNQRFARGFIKSKLAAGWGRRRIEQELYRFGINQDQINAYLDDFYSDNEELERALHSLRKHHSRSKNPRQAAYCYLMRKGFSSEIAQAAIKASESAS